MTATRVRLHVEDTGGTGRPVVLIHGWPLSAESWRAQVPVLKAAGYRVVAYDRRGFGRSEKPADGYEYDTLADDLAGVLEQLDLQDATLVGFSMGGGDVSRYIGTYGTDRVAGLALLGAVTPIFGKSDSYPQGVDQSVFDGIRDGLRKDRAQFISDFATPFYGINAGQTVSEGALTQTLNIALLASLKGTIDCVTAFGETDFRQDMAKVDVPTLVIHGSNDQIVPFETTGKVAAELISHAELKVYDNAPHGFALTHQDQLNEDLLAFVKSL